MGENLDPRGGCDDRRDPRPMLPEVEPGAYPAPAAPAPRRYRRHDPPAPKPRTLRVWLVRIGLGLLAAAVLAVVAGVVLYNFGTMERPTAEVTARYDRLVEQGLAPKVGSSGFTVPIPGCKCHSGDPALQVQHSAVRIKDCAGCHGR